MTKIKAAGIHMLLSACIVGVIFAVIFFVWYPAPTFEIAGAMDIVIVLVSVDLVLGPLLTFVVYKKDKPSLKFDLSVIAIIQLSALVYGSWIFYQERPYAMVFAVDRLTLVGEKHIDRSQLRYTELESKPFGDVLRVYARMPEGEEFQKFLDGVINKGEPDLEYRAEYWEPYFDGIEHIKLQTKPIDALIINNEADEQELSKVIRKYQDEHERIGFLPIATLNEDIAMLMDMDTAQTLGAVAVDPWPEPPED